MNQQTMDLQQANLRLQQEICQYEEIQSELSERATFAEIGEMTLTIIHEIRNR
jgi:phosphoglycerate-specific signal transduction histidine kinase